LLKKNGTGGDADDRDVIKGDGGRPYLLVEKKALNHVTKHLRVWDSVPFKKNLPKPII